MRIRVLDKKINLGGGRNIAPFVLSIPPIIRSDIFFT